MADQRRALLLALALAALTGCAREEEVRRPNVLIVSIDTMSRSALSTYSADAPALPSIERLAARSLVFDRCISTASWTLPAQASLVTGLYPDRHGARHQALGMSAEARTLGELFGAAGYETVAFTDGGFVSADFGFARGFDRYDERVADPALAELPLPRDGRHAEVPGSALFDRAVRYLAKRDPARPFLLFLQTFSMHEYYRARPWARGQFEGRLRDPEYYLACLTGKIRGLPEDWAVLRALYRAETVHLDRGVGRLLDALERRGLAESTLVVFVSDHGEGLDPEVGRIHHGGRLHADLIQVPFFVSGPGVRPGRSDAPVSLVDVAPTLLELAGLPVPAGLDGESLAELARGGRGPAADRPLFAMGQAFDWTDGRRRDVPAPSDEPLRTAVVVEDLWYIHDAKRGEELYRLAEDPGQRQNLAPRFAALEPLRELVRTRATARPGAPVELDESVLERLRALGY